jgi:hypothetical protein
MAGRDRYGSSPTRNQGKKDIVEYVSEMMERLGTGETVRRIGATAIEDGNLTVRNGDIIVSESAGEVVWKLLHGAVPEMRWFPIGDTDTHRITFYGSNDPFFAQSLTVVVETNPGAVADGGKVILSKDMAILSHHPIASGGNESYIWLNGDFSAPEVIDIQCKWYNQFQTTSLQGVYTGQASIGGGFGSYTHTYFSAFASTAVPIATLFNSGGAVSWVVSAQSTSSFTISWSGTTGKTVNWWVFRI